MPLAGVVMSDFNTNHKSKSEKARIKEHVFREIARRRESKESSFPGGIDDIKLEVENWHREKYGKWIDPGIYRRLERKLHQSDIEWILYTICYYGIPYVDGNWDDSEHWKEGNKVFKKAYDDALKLEHKINEKLTAIYDEAWLPPIAIEVSHPIFSHPKQGAPAKPIVAVIESLGKIVKDAYPSPMDRARVVRVIIKSFLGVDPGNINSVRQHI
jgi:hypothetical protein